MLTGRLARIVGDILQEFQEFQVTSLLNEAIALATNRAGMNDQQYINQAQPLVARAQQILDKSIIDRYPDSLRELLYNSQYALFLPERIAKVIINGFPPQKNSAISSPELQIYLNNSNGLLSELTATRATLERLGIRRVTVPEDQISLDVTLPRTAFSGSAIAFIDMLRPFVSVMTNFIELASGSRTSPFLVYTSTTDPTTAFALIPVAAWGVLKFYKLLLEIAEKQISLIKSIKTLRNRGITRATAIDGGAVRGRVIAGLGWVRQIESGAIAGLPRKRASRFCGVHDRGATRC